MLNESNGRTRAHDVDALDVSGTFWLPQRPDHRVAGTLRRSPEGIRLNVCGQLAPLELSDTVAIRASTTRVSYPVVHGTAIRTEGEEMLTVLDANGLVLQQPFEAVVGGTETYSVRGVIVGGHLDATDLFESVSFCFDCLSAWRPTPSILDDEGGSEGPIRQVTLETADLADATVELTARTVGVAGPSRVELERIVTLDVLLQSPSSFESIGERFLGPLWDLMVLLTAHSVRLESMSLRVAGSDEREPDVWLVADFVQPPSHHQTVASDRFLDRHARQGPLSFDQLLPAWFALLNGDLGPAITTLSAPYRSSFIFDEFRFVSSFWSAEATHRALCDGKQKSKPEHKQRVAQVVAALAERWGQLRRPRVGRSSAPRPERQDAQGEDPEPRRSLRRNRGKRHRRSSRFRSNAGEH